MKNNTKAKKNKISNKRAKKDIPPQEGYEELCFEEKIAYLIIKCIDSMLENDTRTYGTKKISDILMGRYTRFVLRNGHQHNPCFGVFGDFTRKQVEFFIELLVMYDILAIKNRDFPTLALSRDARRALRFEVQIRYPVMPWRLAPLVPDPIDPALYEKLYELRKVQSKDEGVPPYCIIPNKALVDLCRLRPADVGSLAGIKGFGPVKAQRYGEMFIRAIHGSRDDHTDCTI